MKLNKKNIILVMLTSPLLLLMFAFYWPVLPLFYFVRKGYFDDADTILLALAIISVEIVYLFGTAIVMETFL